jgi:hypothetical protein
MSDPKPPLGLDPPDIETMQRMTPSELAREARWTAYKSSLAVFLEPARRRLFSMRRRQRSKFSSSMTRRTKKRASDRGLARWGGQRGRLFWASPQLVSLAPQERIQSKTHSSVEILEPPASEGARCEGSAVVKPRPWRRIPDDRCGYAGGAPANRRRMDCEKAHSPTLSGSPQRQTALVLFPPWPCARARVPRGLSRGPRR